MLIWQAAQHNAGVVREALEQKGIEFTLEAVCDLLDIEVFYTDALAEQNVSGMIVKLEGEQPRIYINSQESENRQRFTLAHEIGHFVERTTEAQDKEFSFTDRRGGNYNLHEFYADQFAGALLMPEDQIREIAPNFSERDAFKVSLAFDVSYSAAEKRLERLRKQNSRELANG